MPTATRPSVRSMHAETPHTKARDGAPQWGAPEASDLQHPEESGLAQSLRFYVAHANAGTRNMCDSPVTSDIFRYPPESRTAAAVALAADKEDRLLHLVRGYGCAVVLANLLTTFLCSTALMFLIGANAPASTAAIPASFALTRNIRIIPAGPATTLEEALSNPRSVLITAFDSGGFSVRYRHDVVGWEASRARSSATLFLSANRRLVVTATTVLFEDGLTGLRLAEWELWREQETAPSPHAILGEALHGADTGTASPAAPTSPAAPGEAAEDSSQLLETPPMGPESSSSEPEPTRRRLADATALPVTTPPMHQLQQLHQLEQLQHLQQLEQLPSLRPQLLPGLEHMPLVHAPAGSEHARLLWGAPSFVFL